MKITLSEDELKHAIACYLRANAAVEIGDMQFSLKRTGIEAVVETTVKEASAPNNEVLGQELPKVLPTVVTEHVPVDQMKFGEQQELPIFEASPEELVDEAPEEMSGTTTEEPVVTQEELDEVIEPVETEDMRIMREAIEETVEEVVGEAPALVFETTVQTETVEEMPVQDTLSIADILGTS